MASTPVATPAAMESTGRRIRFVQQTRIDGGHQRRTMRKEWVDAGAAAPRKCNG
jgi:hypothetical protein